MKLLVFAHTPPPYHGQSVMVQLMLEGWGGDWRLGEASSWRPGDEFDVKCYHINARLSDDISDIGGLRVAKILRLVRYCAEAVWCRFRYGIKTLYYVPAPAKKSAILRDWLVMLLVRPWFPRVIFHWHAVGLGAWAERAGESKIAQWLTRRLLHGVDVSIVVGEANRRDATVFKPHRVAVVPNGIIDPYLDFPDVLASRLDRLAARRRGNPVVRVLFLAHCTEEKGIFDALGTIALVNCGRVPDISFTLSVAGTFASPEEERAFHDKVAELERQYGTSLVENLGFLSPAAKDKALREHDILLAPSHHESFGLTAVEAMAYGMPSVITKGTGLEEVMGSDWKLCAPIGDLPALARALVQAAQFADFAELRRRFLENYEAGCFLRNLAAACRGEGK